jgi:hypothetical protein
MDETGMQNPIFNLAKSFEGQGNQNQNQLGNSMNTGMNQMGMGGGMNPMMNNMNMMNPMMNNQMNMMNQMTQMNMNQMNNMNPMMNNMNNMNMMNPMNNMNMMNQGTMMNAAINMQNNNNMANMGNMNSQPPQTNNQYINVYFRAGAQGENGHIMIQCTMNDKVSQLIERYKTKSQEDVSKKKFIFNAKALNPSLTVSEAGLQEGANIFVVNTAGVKGA